MLAVKLLLFFFVGVVVCARPCDVEPVKSYPFCDYKLPVRVRATDLVSRIKNEEKVGLFGNTATGVPSLGIPAYQWWNEALHGVADRHGVNMSGPTPFATSFPQVSLTASSFDVELFSAIGAVVSTEARAFSNVGHANLTFWTPNLNIYRDPRWGRGQETPGEDPYLTSQYVLHLVRALQGADPTYLKVSACCKHFAAYSLENGGGVDRHHFDAEITNQDAADTYFPAFETCIAPQGAAASGIMCSYNAVNGIPACASHWLLTDLARNSWGFDGYVTGDCGAVDDVQNNHKYTNNSDDTCAAVLTAGLDIDCGSFLPKYLGKALSTGAVSYETVDNALRNLFAVQIRLGLFDPLDVQPYTQISTAAINTREHQLLAVRAAQEGIVLLKNKNNALPLPKAGPVAVVGPNANDSSVLLGNYYGKPPFIVTPLQGVGNFVETYYQQGSDISGLDTNGINAACNISKLAKATILVVGLNQTQEAEENVVGDRSILTFPGIQSKLISNVAQCSSGPVIVVVLSGGPVDLTDIRDDDNIDAILWAGYPGQAGGQALAQIIFGEVSPSGRLATTIYPGTFITQVSVSDMRMRPDAASNYPGRTYRFYTGTAVYPFGFGLSYTSFTYEWIIPDNQTLKFEKQYLQQQLVGQSRYSSSPLAAITVVVTNVGKVTSDVSVLFFVAPPNPGKDGNPIRFLSGFQRVRALGPTESVKIDFPVSAYDLSVVDLTGSRVAQSGVWTLQIEDITKQIVVY